MNSSNNKRGLKSWVFVLILLFFMILRLILAVFGNHIDLIINAGWGGWIFQNGPKNFYTNTTWIYGWPTQLPLINLIYGYCNKIYLQIIWDITYIGQTFIKYGFPDFIINPWYRMVSWFGWQNFANTPFLNGILYSMKLMPIFADLGIAVIYFLIGKKTRSLGVAIITSTTFLALPFSWYISSLWGQYDQLSAFLVLIAFITIYISEKWPLISVISFVSLFSAMEIKPNIFIVTPLFLAIILSQKQRLKTILIGAVTVTVMFAITTIPFSGKLFIQYFITKIVPVVLNPDRLGLTNRSFNFWSFLSPAGGWADSFRLLGIKAMYWNALVLIALSYFSIKSYLKDKNLKSVFMGIFIAAGGLYVFGTGMVDRYYFLGVVSLGFLTFYYRKLTTTWILSSLLFSFNLFYSWGYPYLYDSAVWNNLILIKFLSLIQVFLFAATCCLLIKESNAKKPILRHN